MSEQHPDGLRNTVRERYADIARRTPNGAPAKAAGTIELVAAESCCGGDDGSCCGGNEVTPDQLAAAVGYGEADLAQLPEGANLGLSCGNPTALAALAEGEVVVDLGSGGGFDCFIAGPRVGAGGRVIGVDMTAEMVGKARANVSPYRERSGLDNVEFRLGEIEHLPIADASVDVILSNCVINLSPDKRQVWREIARVLKPGGRVAVSDLALRKPLPPAVRESVEALVGCVAGADLVEDVRAAIADAGLSDVSLEPRGDYVEAMTQWQDPLYRQIADDLPQGATMSDYLVSLEITARRTA